MLFIGHLSFTVPFIPLLFTHLCWVPPPDNFFYSQHSSSMLLKNIFHLSYQQTCFAIVYTIYFHFGNISTSCFFLSLDYAHKQHPHSLGLLHTVLKLSKPALEKIVSFLHSLRTGSKMKTWNHFIREAQYNIGRNSTQEV